MSLLGSLFYLIWPRCHELTIFFPLDMKPLFHFYSPPMPKLCSKKREMKFENHSFIMNSGTKGWQPRFCCVRSVGCTNVLTCPLSGAHFVEPACGCSLELATDCGPTPTHTLLANEASPQQNAAVNYGRPWLKDELSHAVRARLAIRLFKVNSFSVETTLTCFCAERLQSFAQTGYAK